MVVIIVPFHYISLNTYSSFLEHIGLATGKGSETIKLTSEIEDLVLGGLAVHYPDCVS